MDVLHNKTSPAFIVLQIMMILTMVMMLVMMMMMMMVTKKLTPNCEATSTLKHPGDHANNNCRYYHYQQYSVDIIFLTKAKRLRYSFLMKTSPVRDVSVSIFKMQILSCIIRNTLL